jgi:hypothetical protein
LLAQLETEVILFHFFDGTVLPAWSRVVDDFGNVIYLNTLSIWTFLAALEFEESTEH